MNKYILIALAVLSAGATPATVAAQSKVPMCESSGSLEMSAEEFLAWLNLPVSRRASIEVWGGCFRVTYTDEQGMYVTHYYDPDSMALVQ